jgi:hypothetical protein
VPQELPHGVSMAGLGLRGAAAEASAQTLAIATSRAAPAAAAFGGAPPPPASPMRPQSPRAGVFKKIGGLFERTRDAGRQDDEGESFGGADLDDKTETTESPMDQLEAPAPEEAKDARVEKEAKHEAKPKPKKRTARRRAILRLRRGREWIFEIRVEGDPIDWDPPSRAFVELADGSRVAADVESGKTTRAGQWSAGQVIRLVIVLGQDPGPHEPMLLQVGDLELEVATA